MTLNQTKTRFYCNYQIDGPKVGRRVVAWRKYCRRRVKAEGQRCWQHDSERGARP